MQTNISQLPELRRGNCGPSAQNDGFFLSMVTKKSTGLGGKKTLAELAPISPEMGVDYP